MEQQKYIRVDTLLGSTDVFILFPPSISHQNMAFNLSLRDGDIISAGFVQNIVEKGKRQANCHGTSYTLKTEADPSDTEALNRQHYGTEDQKFVRFEAFDGLDDAIILIPNSINHADLAAKLRRKPVSAGFVSNTLEGESLNPFCFGDSPSMKLFASDEDTEHLIDQHYAFLIPDLC